MRLARSCLRLGMLLASGALVSCGGFERPAAPPRARVATAHRGPLDEASCASCHPAIAAAHGTSNHAVAFTHATFQEAYAIEPLPFCAGCHAPLADASAPRPPATIAGVGCTTCHAGGRPTEGTRTCVRCHEFPYPDGILPGRLLQKTASEHARSSARDVACATCHMPPSAGHGPDHRFAASRDEAFVRSAATITARRAGDAVIVSFRRRAVGHALPTGDVFRRLLVEVLADGITRSVVLGRDTRREEEADTRPFADGGDLHDVRVDGLPPRAGAPLRFRVKLQRVRHPTSADGLVAAIDGEITLAEGEVLDISGHTPEPPPDDATHRSP